MRSGASAHAGQEIEGYGGFRLLLVTTGRETGGELLEMEDLREEFSAEIQFTAT